MCRSVGNGRQARQSSIAESTSKCASSCFVLLSLLARLGCTERSARLARTTITSTPRSVNDVEVLGALDIQSPGRPRGTTASEDYGVSVVHVTCSYGYE